jgi:hypothetical protein
MKRSLILLPSLSLDFFLKLKMRLASERWTIRVPFAGARLINPSERALLMSFY